ncbi:hypothetical protein M406DRAFT_48762 [Cryphonectria parasitica EP155]|uniref:Uncharacterized protein n=1 Tax=Cryphonectria parasitica (strain ATCC 38755 / EP155) TaxID=660469 RepID=A0A9P4XZ10_CRYP1|nr:uncharacterized protein M406DRAFT_48762 [Cryphonectria parasitica EP155]KAF3763618.1 hypothetical protein M406DRAFT_48762 [Cryphonectria parasitica EP155]
MASLQGESISSMQSMVLDLPPSCIEFCPAHPSYFVVGTYHLEKEADEPPSSTETPGDNDEDPSETKAGSQSQSRNGSLIVFELQDGQVHAVQTIPQPSAVFDLHFQPQGDKGDICAAVSSTGTISFFKLLPPSPPAGTGPRGQDDETSEPRGEILRPLSVLRIPDLGEDILFTYFAWHPTDAGLMAITTAGGQVILVQIHDDYQGLDVSHESLLEHSMEAWVAAFSSPPPPPPSPPAESTPPPYTVFSGGDDSALKYTTLNSSFNPYTPTLTPYPAITLTNHTAGVTALLPLYLPASPHHHHQHLILLLTGSYDDTLRVFTIEPLHTTYGARKATLLAEINLGGGVWRLNAIGNPVAVAGRGGAWEVIVLASCMHAGPRVLRIRGVGGQEEEEEEGGGRGAAVNVNVEVDVLGRFEEHKSMNYGSDWSRIESRLVPSAGEKRGEVLCVSTSFYDRLLCVWKCKLPAREGDIN